MQKLMCKDGLAIRKPAFDLIQGVFNRGIWRIWREDPAQYQAVIGLRNSEGFRRQQVYLGGYLAPPTS